MTDTYDPNAGFSGTRPAITVTPFPGPRYRPGPSPQPAPVPEDDWRSETSPIPPQQTAAPPTVPEDDSWKQETSPIPPAEPPSRPPINVPPGGGFASGVAKGASFGFAPALSGVRAAGLSTLPQEAQDALKQGGAEPVLGALLAGISRLGYEHLIAPALGIQTDPYATRAYEAARKSYGARQQAAQEQRPGEFLTGELGGAVATAPMLGAGEVLEAPNIARGIATGAKIGAFGGATTRAGEATSEGKDVGTILEEAGKGVVEGGAFGTAGGAGAEVGGKIAQRAGQIFRGARNPEAEAAAQVRQTAARDVEESGLPMTAEQAAVGHRAGSLPAALGDVGPQTRTLARSASDTSPEAFEKLSKVTQERFEGQGERVSNFVRQMFPGRNTEAEREAIVSAGRRANAPLYKRSYVAGDRDLLAESPELERLMSSPTVQKAARQAVSKWRDWAVIDGFGSMNPPIRTATSGARRGSLDFTGGTNIPVDGNVQFWDYTARVLAGKAQEARNAGNRENAARYGGLERMVKQAVDNVVPEFRAARQSAASFFGAENALDAGREFVMRNANIREAGAALSRMTEPERDQFALGFATELADKMHQLGYNQNVLKSIFVNSPAAREKIQMALGTDRANQLDAMLHVESVLDKLRQAMGNSQTSRFLRQGLRATGHAGGTAGAVGAYEFLKEGEFHPAHLLTAALVFGAASHGAHKIDEKVASRVGELLASSDPAVYSRGLEIVAKRPTYLNALRNAVQGAGRVATGEIAPSSALAGAATVLHRLFAGEEHPGQGATHPSDYQQDYIQQSGVPVQ